MLFGEISFDTIDSEEDQPALEGLYRVKGARWKGLFFSHRSDDCKPWTRVPTLKHCKWPSGLEGINGYFPESSSLTRETLMQALSQELGGVFWTVIVGPDSLTLK